MFKKWFGWIIAGVALVVGGAWLLYFQRVNREEKPTPPGNVNTLQDVAQAKQFVESVCLTESPEINRQGAENPVEAQRMQEQCGLHRIVELMQERESRGLLGTTLSTNATMSDVFRDSFLRSAISHVNAGSLERQELANLFLRNALPDGSVDWHGSNDYLDTFDQVFKPLLSPRGYYQITYARRRIYERLTDLSKIAEAAQGVSGLAINSETHPMLAWAADISSNDQSRSPRIRELLNAYRCRADCYVSIKDCVMAKALKGFWPTNQILGFPSGADPMNVVDSSSLQYIGSSVSSVIARLEREKNRNLVGLTAAQQRSVRDVYDAIKAFLGNENERERRIQRQDWKQEPISRVEAQLQEALVRVVNQPPLEVSANSPHHGLPEIRPTAMKGDGPLLS